MPGDRRLEVVDHLSGPRRPWTRYVLRLATCLAAAQIALPVIPSIGFGGGHAEARNQQHNPVARQVSQRVDLVAASESERGSTRQKERHVRPERRGHIRELRWLGRHAPRPGEPEQRGRRIGTAAAESCLKRNPLLQPDNDVPDVAIAAQRPPERLRGLPDQIRSIEGNSRRVALDCEWARAGDAINDVVQRQGLEDRSQLVIPVGTHAQDSQIQVDFRVSSDANGAGHGDSRNGPLARRTSTDSGRASAGTVTVNALASRSTFVSVWSIDAVRSTRTGMSAWSATIAGKMPLPLVYSTCHGPRRAALSCQVVPFRCANTVAPPSRSIDPQPLPCSRPAVARGIGTTQPVSIACRSAGANETPVSAPRISSGLVPRTTR